MPQTSLSKTNVFALIALLVPVLLQLSCARNQRVTIRLAGDEWFLDSAAILFLTFLRQSRVGLRKRKYFFGR